MDIVIIAVAIIAALSIQVMMHEFGHCVAAKLAGVEVEHFDIGVGPTILKRTDRQGTVFNLKAIPLGGFAQLLVEESLYGGGAKITEDNRERSFPEASPAWRLTIMLAGSGANFLAAFVIFLALQLGNMTVQTVPIIDVADQDTKAYTAGLRSGDRIVSIDGVETASWQEIGVRLLDRVGDTGTLELGVMRDGQRQDYAISIQDWESDKRFMDVFGDIGIAHDRTAEVLTPNTSIFGRMVSAVEETFSMIVNTTLAYIKVAFADMSIFNFFGPLQLMQLGEDGTQLTWTDYAKVFALLSIALGLINLFPGPIVDGLGVIWSSVELVTGIRPSPRVYQISWIAGFTLFYVGFIGLCVVYEIMRVIS